MWCVCVVKSMHRARYTCSDEGDSPIVGFVAFIDFVAILSVYIIFMSFDRPGEYNF